MADRIGFGKRFGAYLIDFVITLVVGSILGSILGGMMGAAGGAAGGAAMVDAGAEMDGAAVGGILGMVLGAYLGIGVVGLILFLWEGITGAAAGKLLLGIKIKNADGATAPAGQLIGRSAVKYSGSLLTLLYAITDISIISTLAAIAGILMFFGCFCVFGQGKQALHDLIVKTAVFPK